MQYLFFLLCTVTSIANAQTAYTHFNWIDPVQQTIHADTLLIEDQGLIEYIGPNKTLPDGISVIDLKNQYVIAGFIDTHTHVSLGAVELKQDQGKVTLVANNSDAISQYNGLVLLAHGITGIRNPGGDTQTSVRYKNKIKTGEWIGPDAAVAGELLDATKFSGLSTAVKSAEQIKTAIDRQKAMGVDLIKLYTGLNIDLLKTAIEYAHQQNLTTVAHLESITWDDAVTVGLDAIVHAMPVSPDLLPENLRSDYLKNRRLGAFSFFEWYERVNFETPRFKKFLNTLAADDVSIDLTLIAFRNAFWGDQPEVKQHPALHLAHPESVANWQSFFTFNIGWQAADFKRAKAAWPKVEAFVRHLHQAGVHLTVGTDMNNPWVIPGESFHQEMALMVAAGIPVYEVLKMATLHGAQAMGAVELQGTLKAGKKANFVVLQQNPVDDINNSRSIQAVIIEGRLWHPHQLLQMRTEEKNP